MASVKQPQGGPAPVIFEHGVGGGNNIRSCVVCGKTDDNMRCSNCMKVCYCSRDHQKQNWKLHKPVCFPIDARRDAERGRYLVATRLIHEGEIFLKEEPLISAPTTERESNLPCLSCYQELRYPYRCSKCSWPVCDAYCELAPVHSKFECKVFTRAGVEPRSHSAYTCASIAVLRGLLLERTDPAKWDQLLQLEPHVERRRQGLKTSLVTAAAIEFVHKECGLVAEFDRRTIELVSGVIGVNGMGSDDGKAPVLNPDRLARSATFLYGIGSMASHSCVPNIYRIVQTDFVLNMKALVSIGTGETIRTAYCDVLKGTLVRRANLKRDYFFECACVRCADPTELGTHFSSVACAQCLKGRANPSLGIDSENKQPEGCLLPVNPLTAASEWKCNVCDNIQTANKVVELVTAIEDEIDAVPYGDSISSLERLESILKRIRGVSLHPNHYLIRSTEEQIAVRIDHLLEIRAIPPGQEFRRLAYRQIELCRSVMASTAKIWPGCSLHTGSLLYLLQNAQANLVLQKNLIGTARGKAEMSAMRDEMQENRRKGSQILRDYPPGSEAHRLAESMERSIDGLLRLRDLLKL